MSSKIKKVVNNNETETENDILKNKYQRKSLKEHIEELPDTYIGSIESEITEQYIYNRDIEVNVEGNIDPKFIKSSFNYNPGLKNITEEILINAYDNKNRIEQRLKTSKKKLLPVTYIKINLDRDKNEIIIENDGEGIDIIEHPTEKKEDGSPLWIPQLIFGELLTSGNYNKKEEKITGGKNGYGAKLTNIFSTYFKVETVDRVRKLKYEQEYKVNMEIKQKPVITKYTKEPFTRITFKPDLEKFGLSKLDRNFDALIQKRAYDLFMCSNGELDIYYNDKKLEVESTMDYYHMYVNSGKEDEEEIKIYSCIPNKRWSVGACLSPSLSFEQVSFVNGINTSKGGRHIDYIISQITSKLAELILKKKKVVVKENFIKDNLMIFINSIIVNPSFDSQTKTTLTTKIKDFGSTCEIPQTFIDNLYHCGIVEKAIQLNDLKINQTLKKNDGRKLKKIDVEKLDDAVYAGTKHAPETTLILTEGDSAKAMAVNGRSIIKDGHKLIGIYPLKGKLLNTRDKTAFDYNSNKEICDIKKILGLQENLEYKDTKGLRYGKILIMTDQDEDGSHIKGLIMNFISRWPSLLKIDCFLCSLLTPIVKVWKGNNKDKAIKFYTLSDYKKWLSKNEGKKGYHHKYYKGLGTSTPKEAKEYFKEFRVVNYKYDDDSEITLDLAFNKTRADDRKHWLTNYEQDNILDLKEKYISFTDFINLELIHFSNSDNKRSLPCLIDGLKTSQRKILYCSFKRNLTNEIRVAQLAGYVSENGAYHHGEASLNGTIVNMAQTYVGSNNIQLLVPEGQFGTRINGGKDSAQPRYIHTYLEPIAFNIFNKKDNPLLKYTQDDGLPVEPEFYYPIIPMILINGNEGIGTGWSSNIPCFNPIDIVTNIKSILNGNTTIKSLNPWYRGFRGSIHRVGKSKWITKGKYEVIDNKTVVITELPIGTWTENYKSMLNKMIIGYVASSNSNKNQKNAKKKRIVKYKQIIKDFMDESTDTSVKFTLYFPPNGLSELLNGVDKDNLTKFEQEFKLVSKLSCENTLNFYNENNKLLNFDGIDDILIYFTKLRLVKYEERRIYLISILENDLKLISVKVKFIMDIINNILKINNVPKAEIIKQLEKLKYPKVLNTKVLNEEEYQKLNEVNQKLCNYEFLIKMPIYNLTKEKVDELKKEKGDVEHELQSLKSKTNKDLWNEDLDEFLVSYKKFMDSYYKYNDLNPKDFVTTNSKSKKSKTDMSSLKKKKSQTISFD